MGAPRIVLSAIPGQSIQQRPAPAREIARAVDALTALCNRHAELRADPAPRYCPATATIRAAWGWRPWRNSSGRVMTWQWGALRHYADGWYDLGWHPDDSWHALRPEWRRLAHEALRCP